MYYSRIRSYFWRGCGSRSFMKATEINFVFSDKNYSAFFKSFAFKYYVVCGYYMPYEYVQLQRAMVNRIVLRVVTESIAVC